LAREKALMEDLSPLDDRARRERGMV